MLAALLVLAQLAGDDWQLPLLFTHLRAFQALRAWVCCLFSYFLANREHLGFRFSPAPPAAPRAAPTKGVRHPGGMLGEAMERWRCLRGWIIS